MLGGVDLGVDHYLLGGGVDIGVDHNLLWGVDHYLLRGVSELNLEWTIICLGGVDQGVDHVYQQLCLFLKHLVLSFRDLETFDDQCLVKASIFPI